MGTPVAGVEDRLAPRAAVGIGEQRVQIGGQQRLGALRQRLRQSMPQGLETWS